MKREYSFVIIVCSLLFISLNTQAQTSIKELTAQVNEIADPLEKVMSLQPVIYRYNTEKFKDIRLPKGNQYGFDIETANAALPELISDRKYSYAIGKNTYRTATVQQFNADNLIPFLVGAIQQQQNEINKLKEELDVLKKKMTAKE
jgi:uncharacterized coiled-coil protein SlyX